MRFSCWWEFYDLDVVDDGEEWFIRWHNRQSRTRKRKRQRTPTDRRRGTSEPPPID